MLTNGLLRTAFLTIFNVFLLAESVNSAILEAGVKNDKMREKSASDMNGEGALAQGRDSAGPKERSLLQLTDIAQAFLKHLPNRYDVISNTDNVIKCKNKLNPMITFAIKFGKRKPAAGSKIDLYTILITTTPKMSASAIGYFNAFYRYVIPADSTIAAIEQKAKSLFETDAKPDPNFTFLTDLEKYAPLSIWGVFQSQIIQDTIKEIIKDPDIKMTKTGLFAHGKSASHSTITCKLQIYRIDANIGGIVLWMNGRTINLAFPLGNFVENFKALKPIFAKEIEEALKKEDEVKKTPMGFSEYIKTMGEAVEEACKGCLTKKELTSTEKATDSFLNQFGIDKKVAVRAGQGEARTAGTETIPSILFSLYYSMSRFQFTHALLDNARVRKELILPLYETEFKKRLTEEAKSFVTLTEGDFENEEKEIFIDSAAVKKVFEEIKESCDSGTIVDRPNGFDFKCGELTVVSVYEVVTQMEGSIRIDFRVLKGKDEAAALPTGFILSKASMFDALTKIKPELTAYLEGFKAAGR